MKLRTALLLFGLSLGLAALGFTTPNVTAQTETILYSFGSSPNEDGDEPLAALVQGSDGNLYGTTSSAGTNYGTVFRITPTGSLTNLHIFGNSPDGAFPHAALVQGSDGSFYGTTAEGGTNPNSAGTVFRISPSESYTSLYSFGSSPSDGNFPYAGLVQGSDGNFYGTTAAGGANDYGTVFRVSPGGSETNLYSFIGPPNDGGAPYAGLVQGSDGNFYGTTSKGAAGGGNVFRISPSGCYTNLHSFSGLPTDGTNPYGGLTQGSDGNFYATTGNGGTHNAGTVFRISPSGIYTTLYSFGSSPNDGFDVYAGLVQGSDGNFYGTTHDGGANGYGIVFRVSPSGSESNLHSFLRSRNDGFRLVAGLVQGSDGSFYGTTELGGESGGGTVFKLITPLNPPPNQISAAQVVGNDIYLSIPSVAGETYQLQFSSSMQPTNWVNVPGVSVTNSIGALLTVTNFGGVVGPQGFYRFDITP